MLTDTTAAPEHRQTSRLRLHLCSAGGLLAALCLPLAAATADTPRVPPPEQEAQYRAEAPKTILELQQFRRSKSIVAAASGGRARRATLTELNPEINSWFLLTLEGGVSESPISYHLENPAPYTQTLDLRDGRPGALIITAGGESSACDLWSGDPSPLDRASGSALPYAPLCDGRFYLRNPVMGRRTDLERVAEFLRDHVWRGEEIVGFVRGAFFRDAYLEQGRLAASVEAAPTLPDAPGPAAVSAAYADRSIMPEQLGIDLRSDRLVPGRWYPTSPPAGVYVSLIQPQAISPEILESYPGTVSRLDGAEASALTYLVGFDLTRFDLHFALGTEHPRVGWSPRPPDVVRSPGLPGPDGIDKIEPLVTAGMVSPVGKRLCDAHEWEGACAGSLEPPDYRFDLAVGVGPNAAVERMRRAHNQAHEVDKTWSYGPDYRAGVCAAGSRKSPTCEGGGWSKCGSNTYPTGAFPECHSPLGVYDIVGNAAEHMNLPLAEEQMASRGSKQLDYTEMKGSWFIFDSYRAHEDWCRWPAPLLARQPG
jgi:hypothetical protein